MRLGVAGRYTPMMDDGDTCPELAECLLGLGHEVVPFPDYVTPGLTAKVAGLFASDPGQPLDAMIRVGFGHSPSARRLVQWLPAGGTPDDRAARVAVSVPADGDEVFVPWGVDPSVWAMPPRPRERKAGLVWPKLSTDDMPPEEVGLPSWVVERDAPASYHRRALYKEYDVMARPDLSRHTGPDRHAVEFMAGGGILVVAPGTVPHGEDAGIVECRHLYELGAAMEHAQARRGMLEDRAARTAASQYSLVDTADRLVELYR